MHIQRNKRVYGDKVYRSVLLRQCYYEKGKIKQRTIANLSKMPEHLIRTIELAIKKGEVSYSVKDLEFERSYSYGDVYTIYSVMKEIGIEGLLYSKRKEERDIVEMMVIGRILHPCSKLENMRWVKKRKEVFSKIFSLIDYEELGVDDFYNALDWLWKRKEKIERKINKGRGRGEGKLFLYDITSVYFEGEKGEISEYGYSRDGKRDKKQVVIGLVLDKEGYPLGIDVFKGNTSDQKTVMGKVERLKKEYGIKEAILVGDRGMITWSRIEEIEKEGGIDYITCLSHRKIEQMIKETKAPFQLSLFDEVMPVEVEYEGRRYIICKSKEREKVERRQLGRLLRRTREKLQRIKEQVERGKLKDAKKIGERVGRWKDRYKVGKYFEIEIEEGSFKYRIDKEQLDLSKRLLGCYVVVTSVSVESLSKEEVIEHYRSLALVDRAFRIIKKTLLNIRPIYHWKMRRIVAHSFICMLAYWVVVEMKKRLKNLFDENGGGKNYAYTFGNILSELEEIEVGYIKVKDIEIKQIGKISPLQKKILNFLGVELNI